MKLSLLEQIANTKLVMHTWPVESGGSDSGSSGDSGVGESSYDVHLYDVESSSTDFGRYSASHGVDYENSDHERVGDITGLTDSESTYLKETIDRDWKNED